MTNRTAGWASVKPDATSESIAPAPAPPRPGPGQSPAGRTTMSIREIRRCASGAEQTLARINPAIACSVVVVFDRYQFAVHDLHEHSLMLPSVLLHPDIFPDQDTIRMRDEAGIYLEMREWLSDGDSLRKNPRLLDVISRIVRGAEQPRGTEERVEKKHFMRKEFEAKKENLWERLIHIRNRLAGNIKTLRFILPRCELRFRALDIDAIQRIKRHPIVQRVGLTDMSPASIRVVIAAAYKSRQTSTGNTL